MMPRTKTVTLAEIFDAIERNGFEQYFGSMFHKDNNHQIDAACALGQLYLNLEIGGMTDYSVLWSEISNKITMGNDLNRWTPAKIVEYLRTEYKDYLDRTVIFYTKHYDVAPGARKS